MQPRKAQEYNTPTRRAPLVYPFQRGAPSFGWRFVFIRRIAFDRSTYGKRASQALCLRKNFLAKIRGALTLLADVLLHGQGDGIKHKTLSTRSFTFVVKIILHYEDVKAPLYPAKVLTIHLRYAIIHIGLVDVFSSTAGYRQVPIAIALLLCLFICSFTLCRPAARLRRRRRFLLPRLPTTLRRVLQQVGGRNRSCSNIPTCATHFLKKHAPRDRAEFRP